MAGDTTGFGVVDLDGSDFPNLRALDVEEVHVMCRDVYYGPNEHRVGNLSVEPLRLVQGNELYLWSDIT
jgi:hypothetical protein